MKSSNLAALLGIGILPLGGLLLGFSKGPLPGLSGGFQESTCISCHSSFSLNEGQIRGGVFYLSGVPATYRSGVTYPITLSIGQLGQARWGFQLTARFANSQQQAGQLVPTDELTQVHEKAAVQYLSHTLTGNREGTVDGPIEFTFNWVAPDSSAGPVLFNAAGNASDASGDPSGDHIYTAGAYSAAPDVGISAPRQAREVRRRTRERGADFSNRLVNLSTTRPIHRGLFEYFIAHRFTFPVFREGSISQAFGLDSAANVIFGFHYGLGEDIAVSLYRAKFDKTIDVAGEYTPFQQGDDLQ